MNMRSEPGRSRTRIPVWKLLILGIALTVNATLFSRLAWGPQSVIAYRELSEQQTVLEEKIAAADADNAAVSRQIRLLQSDDKYVEKMIRRRLNFVRDNEILYLFSDRQDAFGQRDHADDGKN